MNLCVIDEERTTYDSIVESFPAAQWYGNAEAFLARIDQTVQKWIIVADVNLTGLGGIELIEHLQSMGLPASVILVCRNPDVLTAVRALRQGAADFIEKPVLGTLLVAAIRRLAQ